MRPPITTIDLAALRHNLSQVRKFAPRSKILAIVKADAYGHGLLRAADALADTDAFACSGVMEAVRLRGHGVLCPIIALLGFHDKQELELAAEHQIELTVHQAQQLRLLEETPLKKPVKIWLKFNTGMNRLGFPIDQAAALYAALKSCHNVLGEPAVMTHLAHSDDRNSDEVRQQIRCFDEAQWPNKAQQSIANSAGILTWPDSHRDWIRPGLILYGCSPFEHERGTDFGLEPAMTINAPVIAVNRISAGARVGYGGTWEAKADGWLATVAAGYGDGYPRHARNGTPVLINGCRYGLAGRVSMDMITVDLGADSDVQAGDPAILWGTGLPVEEVAACASTICYELLCSAGSRTRARIVDSPNAYPAKTDASDTIQKA